VREWIGAAELGLRGRLDEVNKGTQERLDGVQQFTGAATDGLGSRIGETLDSLSSALESVTQRLDKLDGALASRPDTDSVAGLIRQANEESELRYTAQLDEAMATFAEVIMGGTPAPMPHTPPPPRPAQRRSRNGVAKNSRAKEDIDSETAPTS
ncbi:MAG: hypothetical protein ACRDXB_22985, partial [Actinomycetes bacterium]